jgi:hypothetical protein
VGTAGAVSTTFLGELGAVRPFSLQSVGVAPGTAELRVALHGVEKAGVDFDLYVRGGSPPAPGTFDCDAIGTNQWGFCRIADPAPGSWFVRAERVKGDGLFQLVATTFGGEPAVCGNGLREPGEACDGADTGTCTTGCESACTCVACSVTDLDVRTIKLAPGLVVKGRLGDTLGTYTAVDPVAAGVTITFTDGVGTVDIAVPPHDPGWTLVNPSRGRYRWRGPRGGAVRRLAFRVTPKRPTEWRVTVKGRNVPGADALSYDTLTARVRLGDRCAERRFHVENEPPLPR